MIQTSVLENVFEFHSHPYPSTADLSVRNSDMERCRRI